MRQANGTKTARPEEEVSQIDLDLERAKYKSFWVGVNRGVYLDSKNPRVCGDENSKNASSDLGRSRGLFEFDGRLRQVWSAYITVLVLYSVIMIPVRLGFEPKLTHPFELLENIILVSFTVDILVNFNTTFREPGLEHIVHSRRSIALNYLKFWFWVDLLSTIPFTEVGSWFASTDASALRAIRMLRLLRIFKLFRINQLNETLQNLRVNPHVISLFVLLLGIFFSAHLFACGWHYMALQKEQTFGGETWVNVLGYSDKSVYDLYVASLYYVMVTMMTVGFGDIHPVTDNERIYAIATMLTGGVVFGAMISRLALILEKRNPAAKALQQNLAEIKSYLVDIGLSTEMRKKVVRSYKYYLHKKSVFGEPKFFEDLPQPILFRLVKQLNEDDIRSVKLFHTYEMEFVVTVLLALKPFQAMAGDTIFNEGDICDTVVFLKRGKVSISTSNGFKNALVGYVRAGGHFGDMEYLRNTTCIATYAASKHSQLLSVTHTTFNQACVKCLDAGVRFRKETELRYKLFNQVLKQNKRDQDQGYAQYTLDESRAIVNKLMHPTSGPTAGAHSTHRVTSRRRTSLQPTHASTDRHLPARASKKEKKELKRNKHRKNLASSAVSMMWVDGAIVDARNLTLLARHSDPFLNHSVDEKMVRVICRNTSGKTGPCEVPESYLHRALIVNPSNPYKVAWDLLIAMTVVYSCVIIPMEIAFDAPAFAASPIFETVTDAFYLLDIVICFRTAYFEDEGDYLVVVPYLVAKHYLFTWCFVDLAGSLPFDGMFPTTNPSVTKLLRVIRLTRLLKLARLLNVGNVSEEIEERLGWSPAAMSLFILLLQVFFVGHLMACVLFGLSGVLTPHPWYAQDTVSYPPQTDATLGSKYILSLYWTFTIMSTVGYGDILPNNTAQRLLCVFVILGGASMFGYMIANVSGLIQSLSSTDSVKDERIAGITVYLDEKQTPLKLQDTVIKHFRSYFKHASPFDVDAMLSRLPQKLANEILLIHNETTLKSIAILRYIDNVSVRLYIFNLMKPVYYEPNEYMLQQGSSGQEIMFIVDGGALAFKKVERHNRNERTNHSRRSFKSLSSVNVRKTFKDTEDHRLGSAVAARPSVSLEVPSALDLAFGRAGQESAEAKSGVDDRYLATTYPGGSLCLDELTVSPDPHDALPQPNRHRRFQVKTSSHTKTRNDVADSSGDEAEYEALRREQTPHASSVHSGHRGQRSQSNSPKSIQSEPPTPAPRELVFSFSDLRLDLETDEIPVEDVQKAHNVGEIGEDNDHGDSILHSDPAPTWSETSMVKNGLKPIGALAPGNFVGHLAVMHDSLHDASVVTTTFSTVYVLHKQDITSILTAQPTVSIQLQIAMSRAISTQSDTLGKLHMRQNRSMFLVESKNKFYAQHAVRPAEVTRICWTRKNKIVRMARGIRKTVLGSGDKGALNRNHVVVGGQVSPARVRTESGVGLSRDSEVPTSVSCGSSADSPIFPAGQKLPKLITRKVKRLEQVLTKHSVLYDSEEEPGGCTGAKSPGANADAEVSHYKKHRHRVHAHRSPLPLKATLRATAFPPLPVSEVERSPTKPHYRHSFAALALVPTAPNAGEVCPNTRRVPKPHHRSPLQRMLASQILATENRATRRNRVMSLDDLETLEPTSELYCLLEEKEPCTSKRWDVTAGQVSRPVVNTVRSVIVPTYANHMALQRSSEALRRRQSFPSLENDLWKIGITSQGLL